MSRATYANRPSGATATAVGVPPTAGDKPRVLVAVSMIDSEPPASGTTAYEVTCADATDARQQRSPTAVQTCASFVGPSPGTRKRDIVFGGTGSRWGGPDLGCAARASNTQQL